MVSQQILLKVKQFKTLFGQKLYRAVHGRPKSLGDGLRRVIGRDAYLVQEKIGVPKSAEGGTEVGQLFGLKTEGGVVTRRYSNGVVLQRGDISAGQRCGFGGFTLPMMGEDILAVSKNGKMVAARASRTWEGAAGAHHYSRDVVTAHNTNYISIEKGANGKIKRSFESNRAYSELGMYEEAFRQLS